MSIWTDGERDLSDAAKLVNENTTVETRYGPQPKKSFLRLQDEIEEAAGNQLASIDAAASAQREDIYEKVTPGVKGTFEAGFTFEDLFERGKFGTEPNETYWAFTGGSANLPHEVTALTDPSAGGPYEQVTLNVASQVVMDNGSTVEQELTSTKNKIDFIKTQPSVPPHTDSTKLIMRPSGETGFYVVTKRARNRGGYIMTLVRNDVSPIDASNTGGASNNRPNVVNNCPFVYVANSVPTFKQGDVTQPALDSTFINSVWKYRETGTNFSYFSESENTSENNLTNRTLYNVNSGTGTDYIEFRTSGDCTVHFGTSSGSSETVDLQVLTDSGSVIYTQESINLRQINSSPSIGRIVELKTPLADRYGFYRVRIINRSVNTNEACYIAGLNIRLLDEIDPTTYVTNAVALRSTAAPKYRNSTGANEFAAKESGGKFFGTFHGGHDQFFERLRTDNSANHDVQADAVPSLLVTQHCTLYSKSRLTPDSGLMSFIYLLTVRFSDGLDVATQSIYINSGSAPECSDVYTHMCTTDTSFDFVYQPIYLTSLSVTNTELGDSQVIEQYNATGGLTMSTLFTRVDVSNNNFDGAYIQDTANFHKQYYGPIVNSSAEFSGGTYITVKEYY